MGIVVFGDSYVAAANAGRLGIGYARLVRLLLLQGGEHMGFGGTGFVKTNGNSPAYGGRLPALLARDARTVIIQASGNDAVSDLAEVETATRSFLTATAPHFHRVIVLGPMWAKAGAENLSAIRDLTAAVCAELDIEFIDALGWLSPRLIGPDGAHPTKLGHAVIALRLASAVRRLS